MSFDVKKNYSNKINPNQLEDYLIKQAKTEGVAGQPLAGSIFDSMASERAESLEYFEETNVETGDKTISAKEDPKASDADKAKQKSLMDVLKGLFSIDEVKSKLDTNNDGSVDDKEMKKFLSDIKGLDGDNKNISLDDFGLALDKMGIDINKLSDLKKAKDAEVKKTLAELNAPDQYESQKPYVRSQGNQKGVGSYDKNKVSDAQQLADALTPGNTLEELQTQKTTLETDIKTKEADIAAINDGTSPKVASAKQSVDAAKQNMDEAVKNDANLSSALKQSFDGLTSKITDNDSKLSQNNTQITQKESALGQGETSVSSLESSLSSLAQPTGKEEDKEKDASISARKSELESQIKDKKTQVETLKADLEKLKTTKTDLEKVQTDLAQQKAKLEPEVLKNCAPDTKSKIDIYNKAKTDLEQVKQSELSSAKLELDSKIKDLNGINTKIQEKQNSKAEGLNFDFNENMTDAQKAEMAKFKKNFEANKDKYDKVSKATGIPSELIAALHWREGSGNFNTYMHNGDPLKDANGNPKATTHVPAGITCNSWEESAIDALSSKNKQGLTSDSTDLKAYYEFAERYNGLGYRNKGVASPYVWSGTDNYSQGKYVADGKYDPTVKDKQLGVAAMLKELMSA